MVELSLSGKSVLVTGAARGLGAAIAEAAVAHDARVVVVADILTDELESTAERLGPSARAVRLDVADPGSWGGLLPVLRALGGRPDVLVNNAGIVTTASIADLDPADFERTLAVNVGGTLSGMQAFLRLHHEMASPRAGSIVNVSSVRGIIGAGGAAAYSASKFAVRGLTKSAAIELGPLGIRVNAVCPGPVVTDMSVGNPLFAAMDWDRYAASLPLGTLGRPVDVGEAVAWLGSDASAFVTGIDLPVDGGLTATSFSVQPQETTP